MLNSPAMRVLSLSGRRILDRLEIELANHAGRDNGRLPVTFADFEEFGLDRHAIAPAIREVVALGFLEVIKASRAGNGEYRIPNRFRLTYRPAGRQPTDDWQRIQSFEQAEKIANAARRQEKKNTSVGNPHCTSGENPHRDQCGKPPLTPQKPQCGKPPHLSRYLPISLTKRRRARGVP
jgi:hypothetical protein